MAGSPEQDPRGPERPGRIPPHGWAGAIGCVGLDIVGLSVLFTGSFSAPPAWLLIAGAVLAVIGLPIGIWGEWRARRAKRSPNEPPSAA